MMPNTKWDGITERRLKSQDHDTLIELVQILKSHVENFDEHIIQDREDFKDINKKVSFSTNMIYLAMGGLGMLQVIIGIIKH